MHMKRKEILSFVHIWWIKGDFYCSCILDLSVESFVLLTVVVLKIQFFWDITLCNLACSS